MKDLTTQDLQNFDTGENAAKNRRKLWISFILIILLIPLMMHFYMAGVGTEWVACGMAGDEFMYVVQEGGPDLEKDVKEGNGPDCVLVLGCGINADGTPSPMLKDRLDLGIYMYKEGIVPKILLSGDNGSEDYDEVTAMLNYTKSQGVPTKDIFCDYAGFSTYDSVYRCKAIFQVDSVVIATQPYHLPRALYIAHALGFEHIYGASAFQQEYSGSLPRELREALAHVKDFCKCIFKPKPKFLGDPIPITGDGNAK